MDNNNYAPVDLLSEGYSWTAEQLLLDSEYRSRYEALLSGFLSEVSFRDGEWYTNMWPACRKEARQTAVLVLGRATANQWAERIDHRDFPVDRAIETAARKDMYWVDEVRSQYIRTALAIVEALSPPFRNNAEEASLDISWSDLYKVARHQNPTGREMAIQGRLGTGELLRREIEVLSPRLVIALTQRFCRNPERVADGWFEDIMGPCRPPKNDGIAQYTEINDTPCIVLPHPQAGPKRERFVNDTLRLIESLQ